ncbi:MAG: BCCT family transporter [Natronospirillum sp.]|uniref:BCCT family transporter n=1 Tax=Natronospirillum sp. TaxID=2812955 RepID=UPI0025CDFC3A|nr:BCCT family transporter [Natronospirillum sp.]MCH8552524.1 BCCT family transporter [Natronospirillum sp.]
MFTVRAVRGLFKGVNPRTTIITSILMLAIMLLGTLWAGPTAHAISTFRSIMNPFLEWYYVLLVAFMLLFMIWLGVGRYKNVRLGDDREVPEFRFFSWITMLFAAGTGVGILFWAVAQPIMQFQDNPFTDDPGSAQAATAAMQLSFFHWGLHAWSIFSFVALVLAYFAFRKGQPLTISSALHPMIGKHAYGRVGELVDILAVVATIFGIATTLGLGVQQMNTGLGEVFGLESSVRLQLFIIAVLMVISTVTLVSGVERGMRLISEANFWLSLTVAAAILFFGPTQYLIASTLEAFGVYLQNLLSLAFYTHANQDGNWQSDWTVFFWGWTMAWSPFVGMFIARISRGRTLREFVLGVLVVPTLISTVWIGLLGGSALYQELFGNGGIVEAVNEDVTMALFATLEGMDIGIIGVILSAVMTLLIGTYLITSANAGTLVVTTILAGGDANPPKQHRILWGVVLTLLTGVLLLAGGLELLQSAVVAAALPFSVVLMLMLVGTMRALHEERFAEGPGVRREAPHEPWVVDQDTGKRALAYDVERGREAAPGKD